MEKFIIRNKETKEIIKERFGYPNKDNTKKIIGFDYDEKEIFVVIKNEVPVIDLNKEYLEKVEAFTNEKSKYPNVLIYRISWEIKQLSTQAIINKLNLSLGEHLDMQYPMWERIKHSGEGNYIIWNKTEDQLTEEELSRKAYIDSIYAWVKSCRDERDRREIEFLTNNTFPSFEWKNRPQQ